MAAPLHRKNLVGSVGVLRFAVIVSVAGLGPAACANQKKIIPVENQEKSEERYGEQQQSMQGLNQTPSEQAAAAHENATRPVEPVGDED